MKVFVVGESSPNPADWSNWDEYAIWMAESADDVRREGEYEEYETVTEVKVSTATLLCQIFEPNIGPDL